jgi:pre-peptidase
VPLRIRSRLIWVVAMAVAGLTCAFPTDKSDEVAVVIQAPTLVVIRGEQLPLVARAFRVIGTDTIDVKNVTFRWTSANLSRATVRDDGAGNAQVTGVNSGTVVITARAVAFEQADLGSVQVRVSNPLEVDSVRPSLVRFGDTITVYGVGVDSIFLASLENATLFDYPIPGLVATRTRDSLGFSTAVFWVPPPARTSALSFIGPGVFGTADDTTRVLPFDALEMPNDRPRLINLDAPRFPAFPFFLFFNPALAFEIPKRDEIGVEWYRFAQTNLTPRDLTLILTSPEARGTFSTFLTDSLSFTGADPTSPQVTDYAIGPSSWTLGPQSHFCRGFAFEPPELQPESTIVALRDIPAGVMHALALYAQPGRYGLAVLQGYVTSDPAVPRDDHEEDDLCNAADQRGLAVISPGSYRDTLSIDNPHDIDWIRFRNTATQSVRIRSRALVSAASDSTDVDLFLLTADALTDVGRSGSSNSDEDIQVLGLPPGDYYIVALDYVGAPTRYWICIEFGVGACALPPPPPPAATPHGGSKKAPSTRAPALRPTRTP